MSATPQVRVLPSEVPDDRESRLHVARSDGDDPVELLRNVVSRLKSPGSGLPDQVELAKLLAEAQEALERSNTVARSIAECQGFAQAGEFDRALTSLDERLQLYPDDPVLLAHRRDIELQQREFQNAARVRTAIEEANWLLGQNRTDLALQSLREKTTELPDDPALRTRLAELEALLPRWEQNRNVQATLARAATLEQPQQWEAALTILEEALQSYPDSKELTYAAKRLRDRVVGHERQKKLERRLERIGQWMAAGSWSQALAVLESTRAEFPGTPEIEALRAEIHSRKRREECEGIVTEARQCLADGELNEAEQVLARGRKSLGPETALDALHRELEAERHFRDELRAAQICFGRRQFEEAERILAEFSAQGRAEAVTLLDAVRKARAASEEENFFERGREKALALMQEQQFAQAADLLCNLLALFPGDRILERDLAAARSGIKPETPPAVQPAQDEADPPPQLQAKLAPRVTSPAVNSPSRFRTAAVAGTASLLLLTATGAAWRLTRGSAPAPAAVKTPVANSHPAETPAQALSPAAVSAAPAASNPLPAAPTPEPKQASAPPVRETASASVRDSRRPAPEPLRPFVPPASKQPADPRANVTLPAPPRTDASGPDAVRALPASLVNAGSIPPPPPPPQAQTPVAVSSAPEKPPVAIGGAVREAQLISKTLPVYPDAARKRAVLGEVRLEAQIDDKGNVQNLKVLSGDPVLAAAAKAAVLKWKYQPGTLNGRPIATPVQIQILFGDRNK
jgi:protein TonB